MTTSNVRLHWSKALVQPTDSIRSVIKVISDTNLQIAMVVNSNQVLLGTVTDGDVRRGILKGVQLEDPVETIMNRAPTTARLEDGRDRLMEQMVTHQFRHIPLVDSENRVTGLETLDQLLQKQEREGVVVLVGTDGQTVLKSVIENFLKYGFKNFYIAASGQDQGLEKKFKDGAQWGVNIKYLRGDQDLGSAGVLSLLPEKPTSHIFVMSGEMVSNINLQQLLDFHREQKSKITMCVREYDFQVPFGVVSVAGHSVKGIDEKPVQKFFVNAGVYVLNPEVLDQIPNNTPMDLVQLCEKVIEKNQKPAAFPLREYWLDMDSKATS